MRIDSDELRSSLAALEERAMQAFQLYSETAALSLEGDAKTDAPWTDRSGRARGTIKGRAYKTDRGFRIEIAHGVDYGLWLELAHEKKFATIGPTINLKSVTVMNGFTRLLERIGTL